MSKALSLDTLTTIRDWIKALIPTKVANNSGSGSIEFGLDANGKGQYRAVGDSTWIPFLSGGGDMQKTLLWTNPNMGANFAAQTITLSASLEDYDYCSIVWGATASTAQSYASEYGPFDDNYRYWNNIEEYFYDLTSHHYDPTTGLVQEKQTMQMGAVKYASSYAYARRCYFASGAWWGLYITAAQRINTNGTSNGDLIPMYVFGVNFS